MECFQRVRQLCKPARTPLVNVSLHSDSLSRIHDGIRMRKELQHVCPRPAKDRRGSRRFLTLVRELPDRTGNSVELVHCPFTLQLGDREAELLEDLFRRLPGVIHATKRFLHHHQVHLDALCTHAGFLESFLQDDQVLHACAGRLAQSL